MSDLSKETIEQLLQFLLDTLKEGKEFTVEQTPQLVREMLNWYFWESALGASIGVVILLACWSIGWVLGKKIKEEGLDAEGAQWFVGLGGTLLGSIIVFANLWNMVKVVTAPKLVIIETLKSLIN